MRRYRRYPPEVILPAALEAGRSLNSITTGRGGHPAAESETGQGDCSLWWCGGTKWLWTEPLTELMTFRKSRDATPVVLSIVGKRSRRRSLRCLPAHALWILALAPYAKAMIAVRGFVVTSIDLNGELLASYKAEHAWPDNCSIEIIGSDDELADGLKKIGDKTFDLVTCFDVLDSRGYFDIDRNVSGPGAWRDARSHGIDCAFGARKPNGSAFADARCQVDR
jgi:hypothetical protein